MKSKYILIILMHIGIANAIYAQSISNVQTNLDNNTIIINYNLDNSEDVFISVFLSEDGGKTFSDPLMRVTGDVGFVKPGSNKRIKWDVLREWGILASNRVVFRVIASKHASMEDPRDGKTYSIVKIGKQVWMAKNLAYKPSRGNYWVYDNDSSNVAKYGYLYDWQAARNVCPTGWHLPSDDEWSQLTDFVGSNPGTKLKAKRDWSSNGNGTNDYGFSALPGGYRFSYGSFGYLGNLGYWWSATETTTNNAWFRYLSFNYSNVNRYHFNKGNGFSVRCLKD